MTKKQIQQMIKDSYSNQKLDQDKVKIMASKLNRSELKTYIMALKAYERKLNLIIITAYHFKDLKKEINKLFADKQIIYEQDPNLIAGVKIINDDIIYEHNFKNTIRNITDYVKQSYD